MKTTLNLLALSVVLFLSACSTSDNFSAMKRKYRPGYYVEFGGNKKAQPAIDNNKETPVTSNHKKEETATAETLVNTEKKETTTYPLTASNSDKAYIVPTSRDHGSKLTATAKKVSKEQSQASVKSSKFEKIIANKLTKKIKRERSSSNDDDTLLIIEIILCFFPFINLIAIFLKDGKQITMNFWIDLILDFLFFLPGIVFALLVVLDVINLG